MLYIQLIKEIEKPWFRSKRFLAFCLLVIMTTGLIAAGGDPCSECEVNREVCGGRPRIMKPITNPNGVDAQMQIRQSLNDSTIARQHQRKLTIMQLNRMIKEK